VKNRVAFLLCLDTAMLLLVVVLECINFTGLEWHQWLGFAFCPVVLLHVVMQWQWFITQFRRMLMPGAYRVRVNAGLNLLLLALMGAVLFSGGFVSAQAVESLGESFGQVPIWSEVHGWLNVALVVLVGLHLGLNWDWLIGAVRRRRPERPALATEIVSNQSAKAPRPVPLRWLGRAVAVLLVALAGAAVAYFAIAATLPPGKRAAMDHQRAAAKAKGLPPNLAPHNRPLTMRKAPDLAGVLALTVFVAVIGRYVFRLRL
jgi:hypothetical protein